jgi:hypothetical protein
VDAWVTVAVLVGVLVAMIEVSVGVFGGVIVSARVLAGVFVGVAVAVGVTAGAGVEVGVGLGSLVASCSQPLTELAFPATVQLLTKSVLLPDAALFCSITVMLPLPLASTLDDVTTAVWPAVEVEP